MAGAAGFEPANAGTKNQCLTTWRRPNSSLIITYLAALFLDVGAVDLSRKVRRRSLDASCSQGD
jgi:hypothetical protein